MMKGTGYKSLRGFTLVELMISTVIIAVALAGAASLFVSQSKWSNRARTNINLRTILDTMMSTVISDPQGFPMVQDPVNGYSMTYSTCLTTDGVQKQTVTGQLGWALVLISDQKAPNPYPTSMCAGPAVEVHMIYTSPYQLAITAINLGVNEQNLTTVISTAQQTMLVMPMLAQPVALILAPPP